ncbi:hypothetical protein MMC13_004043 [Lambiella insularis]|nr:hypothetical protein [Lambiella insularis]
MPPNSAAWVPAIKPKTSPLEVKSAPYTAPGENQIVVKNNAIAVNPVDYVAKESDMIYGWLKYPFILGTDVAGEVVEVGKGVTRFQVGDRVVGMAAGADEKINSSAQGAFQAYTVLLSHMTSHIPSTISYESAAVLPLGLSTAACGLFQKDQLALQLPTVPPKPTGKTVIVWGGSTSVGCNAIQLAIAAGYEVITTCSPKNFDYIKKLGASQAFDYKSKTVIADIIRAMNGKTCAGALSIGHRSAEACLDVLDKCKGDKKFLSMASYPNPQPPPQTLVGLQTAAYFISSVTSMYFKSRARSIGTKFIWGSTLIHNEVGKAIYEDFLPKALAAGTFVAAPEPEVVGTALDYIQAACDRLKKGVSAKKLVVLL